MYEESAKAIEISRISYELNLPWERYILFLGRWIGKTASIARQNIVKAVRRETYFIHFIGILIIHFFPIFSDK